MSKCYRSSLSPQSQSDNKCRENSKDSSSSQLDSKCRESSEDPPSSVSASDSTHAADHAGATRPTSAHTPRQQTLKKRMLMQKIGGYVFAVVFIVFGWWATAVFVQSPALPTPLETLPVLAKHATGLLPDFWISFYRVVLSVVLGTIFAVPLALICSRTSQLDRLFAPVLYLLYPIPKVVLLPVLLVLLGLADASKIVLISITVFFQVLVAVRDAVRALPESALVSVRVLGGKVVDEYRHVIIPATLPAVFTSLRISTGTAIAVLFFAEAIAGSTGLGYFIMQSWALVNYPRMFAGIIALAVLGVVQYAVFDIIERRLLRWR